MRKLLFVVVLFCGCSQHYAKETHTVDRVFMHHMGEYTAIYVDEFDEVKEVYLGYCKVKIDPNIKQPYYIKNEYNDITYRSEETTLFLKHLDSLSGGSYQTGHKGRETVRTVEVE